MSEQPRTAEDILRSIVADIEAMKTEYPKDLEAIEPEDRLHWFGRFGNYHRDSETNQGAAIQWFNLGILMEEAKEFLAQPPRPWPIFEPIPQSELCDLLSLDQYQAKVHSGILTDKDGVGYLATAVTMNRSCPAIPSGLGRESIPNWATHVVWFHK